MKKVLLLVIVFSAGFFTHALFFPDTFSTLLTDTSTLVMPNVTPTPESGNKFITTITYDGTRFSDHRVNVTTASYIIIKNISKDTRMWLISNNPQLATPRGYGETEAINQRLDKRGTFIVQDKNNPKEKIVIVVK